MTSVRIHISRSFAMLAIFAGAWAVTACSSSETLPTQGLAVATLTVTPAIVEKNSTTVVEATVYENSKPAANKVVTFSVTPSTAGYFTPEVDTTDVNGLVGSVFTGTTIGGASITASVSGGSAKASNVTVQAASTSGSGNVDLDLSKSLLLADGASTSQVTITVRDQAGNLAPDSTLVKLSAGEKFVDVDANGYWSNGVDSLVFDANGNDQWDAIGGVPSTVMVLGGLGRATAIYTSGTVASTVYIKATVGDNGITGDVEAQLQLTPNAAINSIFLDADTIHLAVKQTGGFETGMMRGYCFDANGNPVPEGIAVSFIITDGPGGGENIGQLGYGPYTTTTNSQGVAVAPISSGTVSGTMRIRAYSDTVLSNASQLVIDAGPAAEISVGVDTCNIRYWRTVGGTIGCLAVVRDIYHNPVADSTVVYFTTDEGQVMAHELSTREGKGIATSKWISGYNTTGHDGDVWVAVETSGGTVRDSVMFFNSDWLNTINVSGFPTGMLVDGETNREFTLLLYDINNNPVVNGLLVDHSERFLGVSVFNSKNQCGGSYATGEVARFQPLSRDYVITGANDEGIGAVDTVRFFLENASAQSICTLYTSGSYSKSSSIDDLPGSVPGGQTATFNATVRDRFGNPLGAHTMVAAASAGSIALGTQESNLYGEAYGFRFTAPTDTTISKVFITVTDTDPRGSGMILNREVTIIH